MTSSAHTTEEQEREYFDNEASLDAKVEILAQLVLQSKHFIAFTGAGISTACGIPDFRSGVNTTLDTGGGKWAIRAAKKQGKAIKKPKKKATNSLKAIPSHTHMALVKLCSLGMLKHLISQNTDGLHRRSGFPITHLSELHGNRNLEICTKCGKQYLRDFGVRNSKKVKQHETGRKCSVKSCHNGRLRDTIVNFGEGLPEKPFRTAEENADVADLCLAMGSSLTVTPAADFAECVAIRAENKGKLVIVNLQKTPLDESAFLRINAKCDDVMVLLMKKLNIAIEKWYLVKYCQIEVTNTKATNTKKSKKKIRITGIDRDSTTPATIFSQIVLNTNESKQTKVGKRVKNRNAAAPPTTGMDTAVFVIPAEFYDFESQSFLYANQFNFVLSFMGHYREPELTIDLMPYLKDIYANVGVRVSANAGVSDTDNVDESNNNNNNVDNDESANTESEVAGVDVDTRHECEFILKLTFDPIVRKWSPPQLRSAQQMIQDCEMGLVNDIVVTEAENNDSNNNTATDETDQ